MIPLGRCDDAVTWYLVLAFVFAGLYLWTSAQLASTRIKLQLMEDQ